MGWWKRLNVTYMFFVVASCYYFGKCKSDSSVSPFLGIAPQDESYYRNAVISCRENESRTFTKSQFNDNFCDCPDGTDEPGTSACPHGKFYCLNAGHSPLTLYSSRVNDGICDCCDGTDEYDGRMKCPNTCWEAGKIARDNLKMKIATFKDGVLQRSRLVQQAEASYLSDKAEVSKLKDEESLLSKLVKQLKERKEKIDEAEEKERQKKEKEDNERLDAQLKDSQNKGSESTEKNISEDSDSIGTVDDSNEHTELNEHHGDDSDGHSEHHGDDSDGHSEHPVHDPSQEHQDDSHRHTESNKHQGDASAHHATPIENYSDDSDQQTESIEHHGDDSDDHQGDDVSKEELGRIVASRWTGNAEKNKEEGDDAENNEQKSTQEEESAGYSSETDDEHGKYDDEEEYNSHDTYQEDTNPHHFDDEEHHSDLSARSSSWLEKIQNKVYKIVKAVNPFATPVNISDAENVRKEYDEASSKLTTLRSKVSSLTKKLELDFGPEKEFYSFHGQCFEAKQMKYVYKICPFKDAYQQEGHSSTQLGKWEAFEDSYKGMKFSSGDRCWNGPDRSIKVTLRCGTKNELRDVDEPSRCEYTALLVTPAVCRLVELKELEKQFAALIRQQPGKHDEL